MAIVTISRGPQVGGRALAECLAEKLDYKCLTTTDVVKRCSIKFNLPEDEINKRLKEVPGFWKRLTYEHKRSLVYIQCAVLEAARQDKIVYHGLAGQLFLANIRHVFKIRIESPFERRVRAAMKALDLSEDEAVEYLKNADQVRTSWVKLFYGENWNDPALYDLAINRNNLNEDTICKLIMETLKSGNFETTAESQTNLENQLLKYEVLAALAVDEKLWNQPINIIASGGIVTLKGMVKNEKTKQELIATVKDVKGVVECEAMLSAAEAPIKRGFFSD
ncbi:MAG: cytidylate kinase family protein [Candidatus Zixiibacteriota bacterium]